MIHCSDDAVDEADSVDAAADDINPHAKACVIQRCFLKLDIKFAKFSFKRTIQIAVLWLILTLRANVIAQCAKTVWQIHHPAFFAGTIQQTKLPLLFRSPLAERTRNNYLAKSGGVHVPARCRGSHCPGDAGIPPEPTSDGMRRRIIEAPLWFTSAVVLCGLPRPASARLLMFPPQYPLLNNYHLMRAGESIQLSKKITETNPVRQAPFRYALACIHSCNIAKKNTLFSFFCSKAFSYKQRGERTHSGRGGCRAASSGSFLEGWRRRTDSHRVQSCGVLYRYFQHCGHGASNGEKHHSPRIH